MARRITSITHLVVESDISEIENAPILIDPAGDRAECILLERGLSSSHLPSFEQNAPNTLWHTISPVLT
jgi:hypothetical protein